MFANMDGALHEIIKMSLLLSVPYLMGAATHIWWEIKLALLGVLGFLILGVFSHTVIFGQELTIGHSVQTVMLYSVFFIVLGYLSGPSLIKYFGAGLKGPLGSGDFDSASPDYIKRQKRASAHYSEEDFRGYQAEAEADTSYEGYSQYRRAQSGAEGAGRSHGAGYKSEKDKMFEALEVTDKHASPKAIKRAYRKLAWKYHPDALAQKDLSEAQLEAAEDRMQEINHAYDWLKDNGYAE